MNKFDLNEYYGKWVAIDDKDRIISFAEKEECKKESTDFKNFLNEYNIRLYPIIDKDISSTIKELIY